VNEIPTGTVAEKSNRSLRDERRVERVHASSRPPARWAARPDTRSRNANWRASRVAESIRSAPSGAGCTISTAWMPSNTPASSSAIFRLHLLRRRPDDDTVIPTSAATALAPRQLRHSRLRSCCGRTRGRSLAVRHTRHRVRSRVRQCLSLRRRQSANRPPRARPRTVTFKHCSSPFGGAVLFKAQLGCAWIE